MPDIIEVEIISGDAKRIVQVAVEKFRDPKEWLGG